LIIRNIELNNEVETTGGSTESIAGLNHFGVSETGRIVCGGRRDDSTVLILVETAVYRYCPQEIIWVRETGWDYR